MDRETLNGLISPLVENAKKANNSYSTEIQKAAPDKELLQKEFNVLYSCFIEILGAVEKIYSQYEILKQNSLKHDPLGSGSEDVIRLNIEQVFTLLGQNESRLGIDEIEEFVNIISRNNKEMFELALRANVPPTTFPKEE